MTMSSIPGGCDMGTKDPAPLTETTSALGRFIGVSVRGGRMLLEALAEVVQGV